MASSSRSSQVSEIINLYASTSPRNSEKNLTSRPLYRMIRQQARIEDVKRSQALSRQKSTGQSRKPDPEMIEQVIKDLEDVLQEAVTIAQNAGNDNQAELDHDQMLATDLKPAHPTKEDIAPNHHRKNQEMAQENPPSLGLENKKRSSDFSNFIKEYHRTLTWLSNKDNLVAPSKNRELTVAIPGSAPSGKDYQERPQSRFRESVFTEAMDQCSAQRHEPSGIFQKYDGLAISPLTRDGGRHTTNTPATVTVTSSQIPMNGISQVDCRDFALLHSAPAAPLAHFVTMTMDEPRAENHEAAGHSNNLDQGCDKQNHVLDHEARIDSAGRDYSLHEIGLDPPDIRPRVSSRRFRPRSFRKAHASNSDGGNDLEKEPFIASPVHQAGAPQGVSIVQDSKQELKDFQRGLRRHHSFGAHGHFSLHRARRRATIARDWTIKKKRYTATVACISTSLVGLIIGIYAGEVPAIQYAIVDEGTQYAILGNVVFYLGLALTTAVTWPLPLLFGRKKFTLGALCLLLSLQFPQALVVSQQRVPYVNIYRVGLLLPRAASGVVLGFANMNFITVLLDLFGASLQSGNPHQELVIAHDVRRHGGGMGLWLGIWTWCHIGSIGVGFLIGAVIIGFVNISWGFWLVIIATLIALLLNIASPETRIPAYRNSVAEVIKGQDVSRRVGRGEIMMHLYSEGPLYWWEEVQAGTVLCLRMLKQSGFIIMALYEAWIYGQVVMVMILLAALASKYYLLLPQYVALCVGSFPLGALLAVPFQKASLFSRSRHHAQRTDSMTFDKRVTWSSHLVRRSVFMVSLPLASLVYMAVSSGPPVSLALPVVFSGMIGFLTNLALCECYGLIMETFDTSDLQPGFAIVQTASFGIAAAATAIGGTVERGLGAEAATGVVAGVLVFLTLLLMAALTRYRTVQVVPSHRVGTATLSGPGDNLPVIIGNPSGTNRRISLLELGAMSRWTEIRRRNKLLGE